MLKESVAAALNTHMGKELYSAQLYLSMSSFCGYIGLKGAANWFFVQYREEMVHFMKFYTYLNSQGQHAKLSEISAPPNEFKSLLDMYEQALKHEEYVTSCINDLVDLSQKEKDFATAIFLQWFVTEQVEEEENDRDIIAKLKLIGDNGQGLLILDKDLATRVFVPPPGETTAV